MSGLAMPVACERCGASLRPDEVAYICSYECTYCATCSEALGRRCKNCGGELARRPRRAPEAANVCDVMPDSVA
jgi:hypothetical protein